MGAERKGTAETASASWYRTVTIPGFSDEEPRGSTRKSHWFPGFLSIDAGDHLGRESGSGLSQKLDTYLHSQGVSPNLFSYVYLVTQPKILGYKFAPASFWYLYTSSGQLGAIIAEVNNTFDERRAYFLPTLESITVKTEAATQGHHVCHPRHYSWNEDVVKIRWEKDFHVSPFSSRNGYYLLEARDILEHNLTLSCRHRKAREFIDITATLLSSDKRPKLIARLHSLGPPLRLDKMCFSDAVALVWNWWWPGLITCKF
ncbi:MAG: hypothetical protein Q9157_004441 [Trypethelium eluteriae]